jgi:hypothetical protein
LPVTDYAEQPVEEPAFVTVDGDGEERLSDEDIDSDANQSNQQNHSEGIW